MLQKRGEATLQRMMLQQHVAVLQNCLGGHVGKAMEVLVGDPTRRRWEQSVLPALEPLFKQPSVSSSPLSSSERGNGRLTRWDSGRLQEEEGKEEKEKSSLPGAAGPPPPSSSSSSSWKDAQVLTPLHTYVCVGICMYINVLCGRVWLKFFSYVLIDGGRRQVD